VINREKFAQLSRKENPEPVAASPAAPIVDLAPFQLDDLLALRSQIDERLPARALVDLDLEEELVIQFQQTKGLLNRVMIDEGVPANQKAQVINSCSSVLGQITKMQTELYSAERVKALEAALIKTLLTLPEATQIAFFAEYERLYGAGAQ